MAAAGSLGAGAIAGLPPGVLGAAVTPTYALRRQWFPPAALREVTGGVILSGVPPVEALVPALRRHAHGWAASATPVVVSLLADATGGAPAAAAHLEGVAGPVAIELCFAYAADEEGALLAAGTRLVRETVRDVGHVCRLPVIVKLPAGLDPAATLGACASGGAVAAVIAGGVPVDGGYLCGPAAFPFALALVRRLAAGAPLPLIACGGVATAAHAREYLAAGAVAVQVGSAHLANPRASVDVALALAGSHPPPAGTP